jgi:hypothetical protein
MTDQELAWEVVQEYQEYLFNRGIDLLTRPGWLAVLILQMLEEKDADNPTLLGNP